ncbi:MAG: DUF445 domain-containing protein [bacterium]
MWWKLVAMPALGGAIGWLTNWLAIRMLFRPQAPRRVLGLTVQGVIPRRRGELAERVADAIERDLFSHEDIREAVLDPAYQAALRGRLERHMREYVAEKLGQAPALVRKMVGRRFVDKLARGAANEVMRYVPELLDGAARDLESRFDIRAVIREKIDAFDLDQLEALVVGIARRELQFIEILGGVVGALVGLAFAAIEIAVS